MYYLLRCCKTEIKLAHYSGWHTVHHCSAFYASAQRFYSLTFPFFKQIASNYLYVVSFSETNLCNQQYCSGKQQNRDSKFIPALWPLNSVIYLRVPYLLLSHMRNIPDRGIYRLDVLYTQTFGTGCFHWSKSQCVSGRVKSSYHTQGSEKKARESNPSISAEVAWSPICLALTQGHISSAMQAKPEIRFDLHGHHHLTTGNVCPLPASICAWAAVEPWAPIKAMMPGFGWYGDQTGHRVSCDPQVKGGIDFLIRSSTQIE